MLSLMSLTSRIGRLGSTRSVACMATLACLLTTTGCGDSRVERLPVFPVTGEVTLNGQPLPNALVVLHPKTAEAGKSVAARATTDTAGKFQISTYDANDGAPAGEYAVTVQHFPLVKKGESFEPGPNSLPPKLAKPETTTLPVVSVADGPVTIPTIEIRR